MLLIFAFCILIKVSLSIYDIQLDFSSTSYYLYLTENGIEIKNTLSSENQRAIVYSSDNVNNGTIFLNLGVTPDKNSQHSLQITKSTCTPLNLDLIIENLVSTINNFDISFYGSWKCVNNVDITIHIHQPFIQFHKLPRNVNLKVLTLNYNQLNTSTTGKKLSTHNFDYLKKDIFSAQSNLFTESKPFTPTQSQTESPTQTQDLNENLVVDLVSDSLFFEMAEEGFYEDENENLTAVNKSETFVNTITFTQQKITITETAEFTSFSPLYFVANKSGSTVFLTENVTHSNIGVSSDNSPTVVLSKSGHPLSFVNSNDQGNIKIDLDNSPMFTDTSLSLSHVNNKVGLFTLTVPSMIKTVSFASIVMSKISSFCVSYRPNNVRIFEDENDDDVTVDVRNSLNVTSLSEATVLNKIHLNGDLSLFDDSTLSFQNSVTFSPLNSNLKIVFRNLSQTRESPILKFDKKLESAPSRIILSNDLGGELIDVSNLDFIEAKNFASCEAWRQKIGFENGREGSIESRCEEIENESTDGEKITLLTVSVREAVPKVNDDLTVGAIIGIVVGCVAAVVLIVLLAVFLSRKGHSSDLTTENSSDKEDSIGL